MLTRQQIQEAEQTMNDLENLPNRPPTSNPTSSPGPAPSTGPTAKDPNPTLNSQAAPVPAAVPLAERHFLENLEGLFGDFRARKYEMCKFRLLKAINNLDTLIALNGRAAGS